MSKRLKRDDSFQYEDSDIEFEDNEIALNDSFVEPRSSPPCVSPSAAVHIYFDEDTNHTSLGEDSNLDSAIPSTSTFGQDKINETLNCSDTVFLSESSDDEDNFSILKIDGPPPGPKLKVPHVPAIVTESNEDVSDSSSVCSSTDFFADSDEDLFNDTDGEDFISIIDDSLLYKDAPITAHDSLLAILAYSLRHNLDGTAIVNLLQLISLHCRKEENQFKPTLYFFKKHFSHLKAPVKLHYFCSICSLPMSDKNTQCRNIQDRNHKNKKECHSFFLEVSLEEQVRTLFQREGFYEDIQHRFSRVKSSPENIEDIYDGQLYKEFVENGFLSSGQNFSLIMNMDGVPVFKYSKTSMYPVYFAINELPFKKRFKKSNMILGGIWYGKKPVTNHILEPLVDSFRKLLINGVKFTPYGNDKEITTKGILLAATADLPQKADLTGIKHTGGSYSCTVCKIEGKSVKIDKAGKQKPVPKQQNSAGKSTQTAEPKIKQSSAFVFPYTKNLDLRRNDETEQFASEAIIIGKSVFGVKWPTYLSKIMPDMIRGMGIDDLHGTYHGVGHKLLDLWTSVTYRQERWSLYSKLPLIEERLENISLPNFVQGGIPLLRKMTEWKGKDVKTFLLYLSLPVLEGILPSVYYENLALFVNCMYILNSESISPSDLLYCTSGLDIFVKQFQNLYGERHMTINVHYCLHLSLVVNNLGPVRCYSCFPFESLNGEMLRMIHGTRFVEMQLANCAYMMLCLPNELKSVRSKLVSNFTSNLHPSHQKVKILDEIYPGTFSAGNYISLKNIPDSVVSVLEASEFDVSSCCFFSKVKRGSSIFVSQVYTRSVKTSSYLVSYESLQKKFGIVAVFIKSNSQPYYFAAIRPVVLRKFSDEGHCKKLHHICRYAVQEKIEFVPIDKLLHICFSVSIPGHDSFLCERVNWMEVE